MLTWLLWAGLVYYILSLIALIILILDEDGKITLGDLLPVIGCCIASPFFWADWFKDYSLNKHYLIKNLNLKFSKVVLFKTKAYKAEEIKNTLTGKIK